MRELVFLDTECTGLGLGADIWEVGAVRRHADGSRSELHMFVEHDPAKAAWLPEPFHSDYAVRCPVDPATLVSQRTASRRICEFVGHNAVVVGATPAFDSVRLADLFGRCRLPAPPWLYTVVDVCALAAGYLGAQGWPVEFPARVEHVARLLDVDASNHRRHTALGDVAYVEEIFDRCMALAEALTPLSASWGSAAAGLHAGSRYDLAN